MQTTYLFVSAQKMNAQQYITKPYIVIYIKNRCICAKFYVKRSKIDLFCCTEKGFHARCFYLLSITRWLGTEIQYLCIFRSFNIVQMYCTDVSHSCRSDNEKHKPQLFEFILLYVYINDTFYCIKMYIYISIYWLICNMYIYLREWIRLHNV